VRPSSSSAKQIIDLQIIKRSEEPRDLVGTIVFLASDVSDFISGQTINCDGGRRGIIETAARYRFIGIAL